MKVDDHKVGASNNQAITRLPLFLFEGIADINHHQHHLPQSYLCAHSLKSEGRD